MKESFQLLGLIQVHYEAIDWTLTVCALCMTWHWRKFRNAAMILSHSCEKNALWSKFVFHFLPCYFLSLFYTCIHSFWDDFSNMSFDKQEYMYTSVLYIVHVYWWENVETYVRNCLIWNNFIHTKEESKPTYIRLMKKRIDFPMKNK